MKGYQWVVGSVLKPKEVADVLYELSILAATELDRTEKFVIKDVVALKLHRKPARQACRTPSRLTPPPTNTASGAGSPARAAAPKSSGPGAGSASESRAMSR